jgi:hypothetical protein
VSECGMRGMEIEGWLVENKFYGRYIILDDKDDMLDGQKKALIQTDERVGLLKNHADRAIKILNNGDYF